jgi:hypothetical protein
LDLKVSQIYRRHVVHCLLATSETQENEEQTVFDGGNAV